MIDNYSILHIATDEKFINAANYTFEQAFPEKNIFLIIKPPANPPLRYVEKKNNTRLIVKNKNIRVILLDEIEKFPVVVLHGLNQLTASLVDKKNAAKIIWLVWGAEIYGNDNIYKGPLLGERTTILKNKLKYTIGIDKLKSIFNYVRYGNYSNAKLDMASVIKNINYIGLSYHDEFYHHKKNNVFNQNGIMIPFTYYPLEYIIKNHGKARVLGNNILIGNSSSLTNNHLELYDILKGFDLGRRKLIVPLGYGNKRLANVIQKKGKKIFQEKFEPLTSFITTDNYNDIIRSCGIVIMNHYRQEAYGTVLRAMWMGAKVFMNQSNTIYQYLNRIGCHVYLIDKHLNRKNEKVLENLTEEQITENRNIIKEQISEVVIVKKLHDSLYKHFPNSLS